MTSQERHVIGASELHTLRMECKCGGALVVRVDGLKEIPHKCSACGADWLQYNTPQHEAFQGFLVRLKSIRDFASTMPFSLKFEVDS